jgi:hypothetical protein
VGLRWALEKAGASPLPKIAAKKSARACSLFCYEAGRRHPPPPQSAAHSKIRAQAAPSHSLALPPLLPYKLPQHTTLDHLAGLHIHTSHTPISVSTSLLCKYWHAFKYLPSALISLALLFPLARIFPNRTAIQALGCLSPLRASWNPLLSPLKLASASARPSSPAAPPSTIYTHLQINSR